MVQSSADQRKHVGRFMHGHAWYVFEVAILVLFGSGLVQPADRAVAGEPPAWWREYHTLVSHSTRKEGKERELGMMAERGTWPTGWYGAWWIQHQVERLGPYDALKHVEYFRSHGVKNVFYFDVGEMGEFVALVADGRLLRSQWELRFWQGETGQLMWFGKDAFYRDRNLLQLKNYRQFGLPPWTLPDGTRVRSVYDLACTSIDGQRDAWDYSHVRAPESVVSALKIDEFLRSGPDPVPPQANGSLGRICSYDHSNPFLVEDFKAGVGPMLTLKPAFLHFDNYFDNQTLYPEQRAFGPWSVANFKRFVTDNVDPETRHKLGIDDPDTFDIKQYLRNKPFKSRGKRWHFHNKRWCDDPVWNLYVCSKWHDSNRLFRQLYAFCKQESRRLGAEVIVAGNTSPLFPGRSLATNALDLAHFEHHLAQQFGPLVTPTGLPPLGRVGGVTRVGAAISSVGYCWLSGYVPAELSGAGHENLHKVLAFDCLANKAVLDYGQQYRTGYSPGSDASAGWINCFIKSFSAYYGGRRALADVGLVFPGQSLLASVTVFAMDPGYCLYDYLGWAQALTDLHQQWDVVLDHQITLNRLKRFRVVVLPSAACLSDEATAALEAYVQEGGRLVLSGDVGSRYGTERFVWHRRAGDTLLKRLGRSSIQHGDSARSWIRCPNTPGKTYYLDTATGQRRTGRQRVAEVVKPAPKDDAAIVQTNAPSTVGIFTYLERDGNLAVDLVNYDLDLSSDRLRPARGVTLVLRPPPGRRFAGMQASMITPESRLPVEAASANESAIPWTYPRQPVVGQLIDETTLKMVVPDFTVYCTLSLPLD